MVTLHNFVNVLKVLNYNGDDDGVDDDDCVSHTRVHC